MSRSIQFHPHNSSTPGGSGVCLFPQSRCHALKGTVRLAPLGRQSFIWVLLSCVPPFLLSRSSEKVSCPIPAACSGVGTLPELRDILSRSGSLQCFPCRGILFGRSFIFQGGSSMNYPKSTPKRPPAPYIHKVGNQHKNLYFHALGIMVE